MAEMAKRPHFRDRWLDLALPWRKLAEQTEIHGRVEAQGGLTPIALPDWLAEICSLKIAAVGVSLPSDLVG
jgi:hypothetical protein